MPDGPAIPEPNLPDDPVLLKGIVRELLATVRDQQRRIDHLVHQVHQLTKRLYGPRADTLNPNQLTLFDEPPSSDTPPSPPAPPEPTVVTSGSSKGHGRRKLPENFETRDLSR